MYRPPGYPFFLAVFGANPERVLLAQTMLGSLVALCAMILAYLITRSISLCLVAGVLSALSPTGIGLAAFIMADLLLAALFASGLVMLLMAARLRQSRLLVVAGALFGLATLTKPVLLFWSPVALLVFWLFSGRKGAFVRPASLALFFSLQLVPPLLWSAANYKRHGTFTYSITGSLTAREYWGARAEAWIEAGAPPTRAQIDEQQQRVSKRIRSYELSRQQKAYREETLDLVRNHPAEMAMTFAVNVGEHTSSSWNYLRTQLPLRRESVQRMRPLLRLEGRAREYVRWVMALVLLGSVVLWSLAPRTRSSQELMDAFALSVAWLYFVALNGITYHTGPRVVYPVQVAEIVVPLVVLHLAASVFSRIRPVEPGEAACQPC